MSAHPFVMVPAATVLTTGTRRGGQAGQTGQADGGGIGLTVVDGQLCIAISDTSGGVMVARLHETAVDEFCDLLTNHVTALAIDAPTAMETEPGPCLTRH